MTIIIFDDENAQSVGEYTEDMEKTALFAMKDAGVDGQISLKFTDEEEIRQLNADWRGVDRVTDVLSFPANDLCGIIDASAKDLEIDGGTGEIVLGDIAICVKRAKEQAEEYGHSLKRELCFLTAHGALHLMGYDHETAEEEEAMTQKQKYILGELGINR